MGTVTIGDKTFGWGAGARDLPTNSDAYGEKLLPEAEFKALADALRKAGWEPFWKSDVTERAVFLIEPGKWRQRITMKGMVGQTFQVREIPPPPPPPPVQELAPLPEVISEPEPVEEEPEPPPKRSHHAPPSPPKRSHHAR